MDGSVQRDGRRALSFRLSWCSCVVHGPVGLSTEASLREEARAQMTLFALLASSTFVRVVKVPADWNTRRLVVCRHSANRTAAEKIRECLERCTLAGLVSLAALAFPLLVAWAISFAEALVWVR